MLKTKTKKVI